MFLKLKHYILTSISNALMRTLMYVLNAMKDWWKDDDTNAVIQPKKNSRQKKNFGFQTNQKCSLWQLHEINNFIYEFYNRYWKRKQASYQLIH